MSIPPLLSIIITAHNGEAYLAATLDSVINAVGDALPQCELIITNDSSGDGTQAIIDDFKGCYPATKTFVLQLANIGKVRNFAITQCQGEYILMVDGDDLLLKDSFADKFQLLLQQRPDLLISKLIEIKEGEAAPTQKKHSVLNLSQAEAIERFLIHRDFQAHTAGQFFKREILISVPYPDFICYEDAWVFPAILMQCKTILFSPSGFYLYIKRPGSLSGRLSPEKINCLYQTMAHMDRILPARFNNLIACHWLDLFNRHSDDMAGSEELKTTKQRILLIKKLSFLADSKIRLSYKRKLLKVIRLMR